MVLWIIFCLVHSFLADKGIKRKIEKFAPNGFRYYRITYNLFAAFTLILLLWYQFSMDSYYLFHNPLIQYTIGSFFVIAGIYIMVICIHTYFYELSGIQVFHRKQQKVTLRQDGLHRYVRHPLYLGTLLFIWGLFLFTPLLSNLIACLIILIYTLIGIRLEEKQLLVEFGDAYKEYSKKVPGLVPWTKAPLK